MIIACPACQTRYVVPDSAIGIEGRTVRCAKCKHSWFQEGPHLEAAVPPLADRSPSLAEDTRGEPPTAIRNTEGTASTAGDPTFDDAAAGPDFDEDRDIFEKSPAAGASPADPDETDTDFSRFDPSPPFRPRRNMARLWTWAAGIFAVLALGTIAAVNTVGLPNWLPIAQPLFGAVEPDLDLSFPVEEQERRTLPNGTEYFGARIIVTNTARTSRDVPPIVIVLRDQRERQVYSWVVEPPQRTLAPGETLTINEARTDIPKSAVFADVGWAPR